MQSREEIYFEQYVLTLNVEAKMTHEVAKTIIYPHAVRYLNELAVAAANCKAAGVPFESSIQGPEDVRRYVRASLRGRSQEVFVVLGLDSRQRVRLVREVAVGSVSHVEVHPREVFRPLVRAGSHSVILVHNHPSGELRPSASDLRITHRLVELGELLGIPVLDHLIATDEGVTSFAGLGLLPAPKPGPEDCG